MDLVVPTKPVTPVATGSPAAPATANPATGPSAEDRATTFRPVEGGTQLASGETLLVEAYAAIWVILFALILASWRRQRGLEGRVDGLQTALDKARAAEAASGKGGG
jgi:CcmD family protein